MKRLAALGLAVLAAAPAFAVQASAQGPVVLRARGQVSKEVEVGKPLPTQKMLTLRAGDVLMLLDGRGVRTLAGPGTLVGGMFTRSGPALTNRDRVGGVRGSGRPRVAASRSLPLSAWVVDLANAPAVCLPADRQLVLWRPAGAPASLDVQGAAGEARRIEWTADAQQAAWPADLPTDPGTRYRLTNSAGPRELSFRTFDPADPACAGQIDLNLQMAGGE